MIIRWQSCNELELQKVNVHKWSEKIDKYALMLSFMPTVLPRYFNNIFYECFSSQANRTRCFSFPRTLGSFHSQEEAQILRRGIAAQAQSKIHHKSCREIIHKLPLLFSGVGVGAVPRRSCAHVLSSEDPSNRQQRGAADRTM